MKIITPIYSVFKKCIPWQLDYFIFVSKEKHRIPHVFNKDYSDYIFWDNFWGRHNHHAYLADKYLVRNYVKERGLEHTLTKLYGAWDDATKIDFDRFPKGFALKCNHSCATNIICQDKAELNKDDAVKQLNGWLAEKHEIRFEQHYRFIKPMVICEELIPFEADGSFPVDYKIHCANGNPIFIQCCFERNDHSAGLRKIYDCEWNDMHFVIEDYHYSDEQMAKPKHLKAMLEYASILSKGLKYARIDFYDTDDRVIFGEVTLTPMGGLLSYFKQEALDYMGAAIRKYNK